MPSFKYLQNRHKRRSEICARMRHAKAEKRLEGLLPVPTAEPSTITLRGPAFMGGHVVELAARGNDRRGWRLVVDGREGGNLACGAVVRIMSMIKDLGRSKSAPLQERAA